VSTTSLVVYPLSLLTNRGYWRQLNKSTSAARLKFNFARYTHQQKLVNNWRQQKSKLPLIIDYSLNLIQLGKLAKRGLVLINQAEVILADNKSLTELNLTDWPQLILPLNQDISRLVRKGDRIFINNGLVILIVNEVERNLIQTKVSRGGRVNSYDETAINHCQPKIKIKPSEITAAVKLQPDYLSLNFSHPQQIKAVKKLVKNSTSKLIVNVENLQQIKILPHLLNLADGLLIDRQRLSWQIPRSKLMVIERNLTKSCSAANKLVFITNPQLK